MIGFFNFNSTMEKKKKKKKRRKNQEKGEYNLFLIITRFSWVRFVHIFTYVSSFLFLERI